MNLMSEVCDEKYHTLSTSIPELKESMVIVLPVYNRREITKKFIARLQMQTYKDFVLFLFDDGTDGTGELVSKELPEQSRIFKGDGTWFWGGALRYAFKLLKNQIKNHTILLTNDDLVFGEDYLEIGSRLVKDNLLVSTTVYEDTKVIDGGIVIDWKKYKFKVGTPIDCASTRGLFLTLNTWKKTGNINRFLPMHGDYDFTCRAMKKGAIIKAPSNLIAYLTDKSDQKKVHVFSKFHYMNPFHHTIFLVFHCPLKYLPLNLARVWGSAVWKTIRGVKQNDTGKAASGREFNPM